MLTAKEKSLLSALEPRAASEGVEIVTLEIVGSKKAPTIRVYIDAAGGIRVRAGDDIFPFLVIKIAVLHSETFFRFLLIPSSFFKLKGNFS